jgi:hypothetical protein
MPDLRRTEAEPVVTPDRDGRTIVLESASYLGAVVPRWNRNTFQAQILRSGPGRQDDPVVVCDHAHRTRAGAANCAVRQLADVEGER